MKKRKLSLKKKNGLKVCDTVTETAKKATERNICGSKFNFPKVNNCKPASFDEETGEVLEECSRLLSEVSMNEINRQNAYNLLIEAKEQYESQCEVSNKHLCDCANQYQELVISYLEHNYSYLESNCGKANVNALIARLESMLKLSHKLDNPETYISIVHTIIPKTADSFFEDVDL